MKKNKAGLSEPGAKSHYNDRVGFSSQAGTMPAIFFSREVAQ